LATTAYSANDHHAYLPIAILEPFVRRSMIIPVIFSDVKRRSSRCIRIAISEIRSRSRFFLLVSVCILSFLGAVIFSHTARTPA
jgi:hypothetical protein